MSNLKLFLFFISLFLVFWLIITLPVLIIYKEHKKYHQIDNNIINMESNNIGIIVVENLGTIYSTKFIIIAYIKINNDNFYILECIKNKYVKIHRIIPEIDLPRFYTIVKGD